ncbi:MAG: AI-2E family transporter [Candidatus Binatia bacterium]
MTKHNTTERRAFLVLLLLLMFASFYVLFPFLYSILFAIVLTVLFYPLHQRFRRWTKQRENISAGLSVLAVLLLMVLPIAVILTLVTGQIAGALENIPALTSREALQSLLSNWYGRIEPLLARFENSVGIKLDILNLGWRGVKQFADILAGYSPSVIAGTASFFIHFFIMLVVLFYLFRDGGKIYQVFLKVSPVKDQYEENLAHEIRQTVYGVFYGSFLTSLVQAVLATIGFWIAGINGFLVWGLLTFFFSFIPIIGTAGVLVPMVLIQFIQGKTYQGIFLAVYGAIIIGSADNLLKPLLIKSNMHPVLLFLSLFGGLAVFGAMGLLLGPILLALATATVKIYLKDFQSA